MSKKFCLLIVSLLIICPLYSQDTKKNRAYFKGDTSKVKLLLSLSKEYNSIDRKKSLEHAKEAISIAEKISFTEGKIKAYANIARIYYQQREFDQSIRFNIKHLKLLQQKKDWVSSAGVMNNLGAIYVEINEYKKAAKCLVKSIQITKDGDNIRLLATNHNNLGMIYFITKRYKDAETQYKKAIQLVDTENGAFADQLRIESHMNLLDIYHLYGDSVKFNSYFDKTWTLSQKMSNKVFHAWLINTKSIKLLEMGKIKQAEEQALKAHKILVQYDDQEKLTQNLRQLGTVYFQLENWELSKKYFDEHYKNSKASEWEDELAESHYYLAKLSKKLNKPDDTFFHLEQHVRLNDSIKKKEQDAQIAGIIDDYGNRDKTFKEQVTVKESNGGEINKSVLIIALLIFLILTFTIFNRQRKLVKTRKQEIDQKSNELISYTHSITQKNSVFRELKKVTQESGNDSKTITKIKTLLKSGIQVDHDWKEFNRRFEQVHLDFFNKLNQIAPDLTPTERKVCALLHLRMETKIISSLLNIETTSLHVTRSKIRKKMNLDSDINLTHFISLI